MYLNSFIFYIIIKKWEHIQYIVDLSNLPTLIFKFSLKSNFPMVSCILWNVFFCRFCHFQPDIEYRIILIKSWKRLGYIEICRFFHFPKCFSSGPEYFFSPKSRPDYFFPKKSKPENLFLFLGGPPPDYLMDRPLGMLRRSQPGGLSTSSFLFL